MLNFGKHATLHNCFRCPVLKFLAVLVGLHLLRLFAQVCLSIARAITGQYF